MLARFTQWVKDLWRRRSARLRSPHWEAVRKAHLQRESACAWCGGIQRLEVHHIQPFHERPDLELADANLITLCEAPGRICHLAHGHLGNWRRENPLVREQCCARKAS